VLSFSKIVPIAVDVEFGPSQVGTNISWFLRLY